jgi:hypothetical protein
MVCTYIHTRETADRQRHNVVVNQLECLFTFYEPANVEIMSAHNSARPYNPYPAVKKSIIAQPLL